MKQTANNRRTNQGFLRVPYVWLRGGSSLSLSALITKAAVFSFTKPDEAAEFTYKDLKERYALSHATVARCVTSLCTRGEIRRGDRKRDYRCDGTSSDEVFIKVEEWLFHARFGAEEEYLTRSEIMILSLVRSHPDNFTASVRGIARILDLSPTTVCAAREKLLRLHLIYCLPGRGKGKPSIYTSHESLLRAKKREFTRPAHQSVQKRSNVVSDADARAERERYYAELQQREERRVRYFEDLLQKDPAYARAHVSLRKLEIDVVKAEISGENVEALKAEETNLRALLARRMTALNVSPKDLERRVECERCKDTGIRQDGTFCDCYLRR